MTDRDAGARGEGVPPWELEDDFADPDEWGSEDDSDEEMAGECRKMPDGQCLLAGSEWCEFDCPFRDDP